MKRLLYLALSGAAAFAFAAIGVGDEKKDGHDWQQSLEPGLLPRIGPRGKSARLKQKKIGESWKLRVKRANP